MREIENAERFFKEADELVAYVAHNNKVAACLYDLQRLPEELEVGTRTWLEMLIIVSALRDAYENHAKEDFT